MKAFKISSQRINKALAAALTLTMLLTMYAVALAAGTSAETANPALTMEDAKAIALKEAQAEENAVFMTLLKVDREDGRREFEIEFIYNGVEYEYDIDAETGEVRKVSTETASGRKSEVDKSQYLTMDEVKEKALAHAGIAAEEATFVEIEFDFDDGRAEYDVEFTAGGMVYELELDAASGEVLKYEMETDRTKR